MAPPAKLLPEQLPEVLRMLDEGKAVREIGRLLAVSHSTILRTLERWEVEREMPDADARVLAECLIGYLTGGDAAGSPQLTRARRRSIEQFAIKVTTWHQEGAGNPG